MFKPVCFCFENTVIINKKTNILLNSYWTKQLIKLFSYITCQVFIICMQHERDQIFFLLLLHFYLHHFSLYLTQHVGSWKSLFFLLILILICYKNHSIAFAIVCYLQVAYVLEAIFFQNNSWVMFWDIY